ncbi:MAG TPA: 3-carboxy-cis,cis-muconate cycloisomerase [Polyangiaceae bacterium]|nr:3-carboxy-cis,cis-muconate cycloisomerase [Polyangiaceae bacterium]
MTIVLSSSIFGATFADAEVAALLSDEAFFRSLLQVEVALARTQAALGIIPAPAAVAIEAAAAVLPFDPGALAAGVLKDGVPIVALVAQLRAAVAPDTREFVHWGATSQDIVDTATVLGVGRVLDRLDAALVELLRRLASDCRAHRHSVMAARTHSQHALPTSFGLKLAGWALPLVRHRERLVELRRRFGVLQLGGAAGTLLALGPRALELGERLARELGLALPELPWHAQRDTVAELGAWLALLTGSLGKLAQDVVLLCQSEVAELSEAPHGQRGGSSSMPQKNNPMRSEQILAAARCVSAQLSALMGALVQEHERGTHGWQVEWLCLSPMLSLAAGACKNALELTRDWVIDVERMRSNVMSGHGLLLSEAAVGALSDPAASTGLTRSAARALVSTCAARALEQGRSLIELLRDALSETQPQNRVDWASLALPENHLGQADALIERALARIDAASAAPAPEAA